MDATLSGWYKQFTSLNDYYAHFLERFSQHDAFLQFGSTITYGEVAQIAQKIASFFQRQGIKKGDRVAIILPNCLVYPSCIIATHLAGGVVLNLNPEYTTYELEVRLLDAEPHFVIVLDLFMDKMADVLKKVTIPVTIVASTGDLLPLWKRMGLQLFLWLSQRLPSYSMSSVISLRKLINSDMSACLSPVNMNPSDLAFLQYTGGTTGTVKAAMLTHGNLLANLEQMRLPFCDVLDEGKEVSLFALPLYHIFCLTVNFLLSMGFGVKHVMIIDPRRLSSVIRQAKKLPISVIVGVNTLFYKLLQHPHFSSLNLSRLKLVVAGGMPVHESVTRDWKVRTGVSILEGYGLTETSPVVCINPYRNSRSGSIGVAVSDTEIIFLDDAHQPVKKGELGELAIRGPQVMQGYWKRHSEQVDIFTKDHFFLTGDLGYQDSDGFVFLKERKKDMIDISGLKVYPSEVEHVLLQQIGVADVAVVGEKTPLGHEQVVAYIVSTGSVLESETLLKACREKLTPYKIPKKIYFCQRLPKNNVGKVLKRLLVNGECLQQESEKINEKK